MARSIQLDYYQAFRFGCSFTWNGIAYVQEGTGFNNVTIPETSQEAAEYREGTFTWTQKYPGPPTVSEVTLQRGVTKQFTGFWDWIIGSIYGREYRVDLIIHHFHRSDDIAGAASFRVNLSHAFPSRVKPTGDLDATSSEISLAELELTCEAMGVVATA